jgi:hypothetical protein
MSVRIAIDGKFQFQNDALTFSGAGGELTCITSLNMDLAFQAGLTECRAGVLSIRVTRDASHGTPEDLLAAKYQFGKGKRGEEWVFPGEVWLIDDNHTGAASVVGKFEMQRAQVMSVQPEDNAGPPTETVVIHAYEWKYSDVVGGNTPMAAEANLVPALAFDAPKVAAKKA